MTVRDTALVVAPTSVRRDLFADLIVDLEETELRNYGYERAAAERIDTHQPRGLFADDTRI